jgi:enoyl-CoA hydratase
MSLVTVTYPLPDVVLVTLNRPPKRNALSAEMLTQLSTALTKVAARDGVRAVVLTGADPAFCAGLDLTEVGADAHSFSGQSLEPLEALAVPVIAAVNGDAITGGLEIALACDFRIASDRARFADTHVRVGVVPGWGLSYRLPAAIGQSWARQMSFTGNFIDAAVALRIGLINEVVPHEALLPTAISLAQDIASTEPDTLTALRGLYDLVATGTAADGRNAESRTSDTSLTMADPQGFAARRAALLQRSKQQTS